MNAGEVIVCETGAMSWMNGGVRMETNTGGGFSKMLGCAFTGESLFLNRYVADSVGTLALASCTPGEIREYDVTDRPIIVQKGSFLAMDEGVNLSVFVQQKVGTGLFGGEGFFNTVITGPGRIVLQTQPMAQFVIRLAEMLQIKK